MLDPTGLLVKFAQILKIINKIRFVNINFGSTLQAFLNKVGELFVSGQPHDEALQVTNSIGSRGKVSTWYVSLSFGKMFALKLALYLLSWSLLLLHSLIVAVQGRIPAAYLKVIYWHPKVHVSLFNALHMDFLFYGARAYLHGQRLWTDQVSAAVCGNLVVADFLLLYLALTDERSWQRVLRVKRLAAGETGLGSINNIMPTETEKSTITPETVEHPRLIKNDNELGSECSEHTSESIDYKRTYQRLSLLYHGSQFLSNPLAFSFASFSSRSSRAHLFVHLLRVSAYQVFVVSCQYANKLLLGLLICLEVCRGSLICLNQQLSNSMASRVQYYGELTQSVFLSMVLFASFVLSFEDDRHPINLRIQLFVVYTIIVAVAVEWTLLLLGIFMQLVETFRKKRVDKQKLAQAMQYIFYRQEPVESNSHLCCKGCKDSIRHESSDTSQLSLPGRSKQHIIRKRNLISPPVDVARQSSLRELYKEVYMEQQSSSNPRRILSEQENVSVDDGRRANKLRENFSEEKSVQFAAAHETRGISSLKVVPRPKNIALQTIIEKI